MTVFDIEQLKTDVMNSLRTYAYPYQSLHNDSISLYSVGTITQSFSLFSGSVSTAGIYISSVIGNPVISLSFYNNNTLVVRNTIPATIGWNTIRVNKTDLSSSRGNSLVISGTCDVDNDVYIGTSTITSYFYGNAGSYQTAFTIGISDFIYRVFPSVEIDNNRLPVVCIDINGRPTINEPYLTGDQVWMNVNVQAEVYGKSPTEVDRLVSGLDRGMVKNARGFMFNDWHIRAGNLSQLQYLKERLYTRAVTWQLRMKVARE